MTLIFFLTSFVVLISILGYGLLFSKIINFEKFNYNFGLTGFLGLFFLSLILSYDHLIISHNYFHNIFFILFGLIFFVLLSKKRFNDFKLLFIIFSLLFIALLIAKTNEDYPYYHLPNSLQFAQHKLQFGLGNLNHGFKHISSLFMLMSFKYLPFFEHYLFNLTNFCFLVFFVYFVIKELSIKTSNNLNISQLILCFFLILILAKFNRLAEYGTDLAGQILVVVFIFYFFESIFNQKLNFKDKVLYFKISIILLVFAISTKFILVIYYLIFLLLFFSLKEKKKFFFEFIKFKYIIFLILPIVFLFFFNFSSTGCIIYPVVKTCLSENFNWALPLDAVKSLNIHYELWSKGGMGPNFKVDNPENYIESLNWIPNWISVYFFNKFSDYLLVTSFIIFIFISFFYKEILKKKKKNKINFNLILFYFLLVLIYLIWFFNFPTLRYAGYIIVYFIIIFPIIIYLNNKIDCKQSANFKKISIIFLVSYIVFFGKNSLRIYNEISLSQNNHHNFQNFPFYWVDDVAYEEIEINGFKVYKTKSRCWNIPSTCIRVEGGLKIEKKNNYIFYSHR